jgi:hypothetical protein
MESRIHNYGFFSLDCKAGNTVLNPVTCETFNLQAIVLFDFVSTDHHVIGLSKDLTQKWEYLQSKNIVLL